MKVKSSIYLLLVLALTVALLFGVYYGFSIKGTTIIPGMSQMRMGLDIAGGVRIVYKPEGDNITTESLEVAQTILRKRLDAKGLNEATVALDDTNVANPMIIVEIPGFTDPQQASDFLGKTAKLQFVEPDGTIVMEGSDIVGAKALYGQVSETLSGNSYYIQLQISNEATAKFADATERLASAAAGQNIIYILLDDQIISYPSVNQRIDTSTPIITGNYTHQEAQEQAELISSGALPFTLAIENQEYIGPTIGHQAFTVTLRAGIVAAIVVALLLIIVYRLLGLMTLISLSLFGGLFVLVHQLGGITITLPGIAGIILTIAMAVDASVIVFERFREEIKAGKTLKTAVSLSFSRAFSAVRDSNLTTIISGALLWYFGTGPVQGFAIALVIGTILSFIVSMGVLRFLVKWIAQIVDKPNKHIYGI